MGNGISQKVYGVLEEDQSQSPKSNLKTLPKEFDPRSPSEGVVRTPIQFVSASARVPDPRSPTTGIERTPIHPADNPNGSTVDLISIDEEARNTKTVLPFNLHEADEGLISTGNEPLVPPAAISILDFSISETVEPVNLLGKTAETYEQPKSTFEPFKPQQAQVHGKTQKVKSFYTGKLLKPSVPRSPLSTQNVDTGSLRSRVQLKEARKVESMRLTQSPGDLRLRNVSLIDKENM